VLSGDNYSVAQAINMSGTIVGYSKSSTGVQRAFASYNNGTMVDLLTVVNSNTGWTLQAAEGINVDGWIVGYGLKNGQSRAFLLTPNF
jgi:probable HAF family extracellular repeat protein